MAIARTIVTIALVVAIYYLLPMNHSTSAVTVLELTLGVLVLFAVFAWEIRQIIRSEHPTTRAVESLAFTVPLYILIFATTYFLMAHANGGAFGGAITRTDALYFSTTIFTTVGFGDITAKTQAARVVVTLQMFLDLVFLGLVARVVVNAVKLGQSRHAASAATGVTSGHQPT